MTETDGRFQLDEETEKKIRAIFDSLISHYPKVAVEVLLNYHRTMTEANLLVGDSVDALKEGDGPYDLPPMYGATMLRYYNLMSRRNYERHQLVKSKTDLYTEESDGS